MHVLAYYTAMINQTIQEYKNMYVVRSRAVRPARNATHLLEQQSQLRDEASKTWHGLPDAVAEIRDQRGGAL